MKQRKRIFLVALLMLIIGAFVWTVSGEREPEYAGKSLTAWLEQNFNNMNFLYTDNVPPPNYLEEKATRNRARKEAEIAIKHIGTNALPYLLRLVAARDSSLKVKATILISKQSLVRIHMRTAMQKQWMALQGFQILRLDATPAIPDLITLLCNKQDSAEANVAQSAAECLASIGPVAIPKLLPLLTNCDADLSRRAAGALKRMVPHLTYLLRKDLDETNRLQMAIYLGEIGINDLGASEALTDGLNDKSLLVRSAATNALKKLNPEAAAKAGIK